MGIIEVVLSYIGQADVIASIKIKHVIAYTAANLESAVKAVEVSIVIGTECRPRAIVLDLSVGAHCQITTGIGLNGGVVSHKVLVLDEQRHFQIVEIVGEFSSTGVTLAALLAVIESCFQEERSTVGGFRQQRRYSVHSGCHCH